MLGRYAGTLHSKSACTGVYTISSCRRAVAGFWRGNNRPHLYSLSLVSASDLQDSSHDFLSSPSVQDLNRQSRKRQCLSTEKHNLTFLSHGLMDMSQAAYIGDSFCFIFNG